MKAQFLGLALLASASLNTLACNLGDANCFAISDLRASSGTFNMPTVTGAPVAWTNTANPSADLHDGYVNLGGIFLFFGSPVSVYTAASNTGAINSPAGTVAGGPVPTGTLDTVAGTINVDLSSVIANWNGTEFNQGNANVSGTWNSGTGTYNISWDSLIVGGPFNGKTGQWTMTGYASPVPEADSVLLVVAGLGLALALRRRMAR